MFCLFLLGLRCLVSCCYSGLLVGFGVCLVLGWCCYLVACFVFMIVYGWMLRYVLLLICLFGGFL